MESDYGTLYGMMIIIVTGNLNDSLHERRFLLWAKMLRSFSHQLGLHYILVQDIISSIDRDYA